MVVHTPWGAPQTQREIAPGITRVDTASHGGYYLTPQRWVEFQVKFPTVQPYAGPQWFEEDEDWAWVYMCWPELTSDKNLYYAVKTLEMEFNFPGYVPRNYGQFIPPEVRARAEAWYAANNQKYETTGGHGPVGPRNLWCESYRQINGPGRFSLLVPSAVVCPSVASAEELAELQAHYPTA